MFSRIAWLVKKIEVHITAIIGFDLPCVSTIVCLVIEYYEYSKLQRGQIQCEVRLCACAVWLKVNCQDQNIYYSDCSRQ
jgi:hypothetical protein